MMDAGDVFGEMALILYEPRAATRRRGRQRDRAGARQADHERRARRRRLDRRARARARAALPRSRADGPKLGADAADSHEPLGNTPRGARSPSGTRAVPRDVSLRVARRAPVSQHRPSGVAPQHASSARRHLGTGAPRRRFFFCISGFLITSLMIREEARTGRLAVGRFYARRSATHLPALLRGAIALRGASNAVLARGARARSLPSKLAVLRDLHVELVRRLRRPFPGDFLFCLVARPPKSSSTRSGRGSWRARKPSACLWSSRLSFSSSRNACSGACSLACSHPIAWRAASQEASRRLCAWASCWRGRSKRRSFVLLYRWLGHRWSAPLILGALAFSPASRKIRCSPFDWR